MTMTIDNSNRLWCQQINIYLMRICESSNVWRQSSWMKTDILLIHISNRKSSRYIKNILQIDLFVNRFIVEENHLYELRLYKIAVNDDYRYNHIYEKLLYTNISLNNWYIILNKPKLLTRLWFLLWCDWWNCKICFIQAIRWLRMKIELFSNVNKSYSSSLKRCWEYASLGFDWANSELSISWKKRLNSCDIYWRNINHKLLKKWKIQIKYRIEQFNNTRYILKQLYRTEQRCNKKYFDNCEFKLCFRRYQSVRYCFNCEYRFVNHESSNQ